METKTAHAAAASAIRKELKEAFPDVKFTVRSECFAGGNSVRVKWTDGPITDDIDRIIRKYQYGTFDWLTDCYNADSIINEIPQVKYVTHYREMSDDVREKIRRTQGLYYGFKIEDEEYYQKFMAYGRTIIYRCFNETAF
jgi:hypothetical protein